MAKRPGTGWEETVETDFPMLKRSTNSGAKNGDGDLQHPRFLVECKDEAGNAIRFPHSDLVKIVKQSLNHNRRHWMRFYRNGGGDRVVSMNYELAQQLMEIVSDTLECPKCKTELKIDW